jgi:hypothetical protein
MLRSSAVRKRPIQKRYASPKGSSSGTQKRTVKTKLEFSNALKYHGII